MYHFGAGGHLFLTGMETPPIPRAETPARSRRSVLFLRLLLLFLAAGAVVVALVVAWRSPPEAAPRYVCPMHPEVRGREPSPCPLCGMALDPIGRAAHDRHDQAASLPDLTAFENVRKHNVMGFVRVRSLPAGIREIRGPAWATSRDEVSAVLYRDQVDSLSADETGAFLPTASPQASVAVMRSGGPPVDWDRSTSLVRFRVKGERVPGKRPPPPIQAGQVGWLEIAPKPRAVVAVPVASILQEPEGPYVLAWAQDAIEKRRIEIGEYFATQGFAVALSGVRPNDLVVTRATFFMDADRRSAGGEPRTGDEP